MTAAIWKLRQPPPGHGWVREVYAGAPIVTAVEAEAFEWSTAASGRAALERFPPGVKFEVVARPARPGGPDRGFAAFRLR